MADPNQTPARGDWACPCSGCSKAVAFERKQLLQFIQEHKLKYAKYRGSSIDKDGNILWMKDDVQAYAEGLDFVTNLITDRIPKPKARK
jgi:hypothetical protein